MTGMTDGRRWAITALAFLASAAILSALLDQPAASITAAVIAGLTFVALPLNKKKAG